MEAPRRGLVHEMIYERDRIRSLILYIADNLQNDNDVICDSAVSSQVDELRRRLNNLERIGKETFGKERERGE